MQDETLNFQTRRPASPELSLGYLQRTAPGLVMFGSTAAGMAAGDGSPVGPPLLLFFLCIGKFTPGFRILLCICLLSGFLRTACPKWNILNSPVPEETVQLQAEIMIEDAFAAKREIREYQPDNLRVTGTVIRAENLRHGKISSVKIVLTMPFKQQARLKELRPGQIISCSGIFRPLPEPGRMDYTYGQFLKSTGVRGFFKISRISETRNASSLKQKLLSRIQTVRETAGTRILRAMPAGALETRMLLALALGYGNVLDKQTRQSFIQSGTIHIFAISGLHVGLFFSIVYLMLQRCGLSINCRNLLSGGLTAVYVCLTGLTPSSLRALGMALLILYAKFRRRPPLPLNALGQIGLVSILWNPYLLYNIGFLFSYTIVFFLLASIPRTQYLQQILREREQWIPRRLNPGASRGANIVCSLLSCLTAWYAGIGISMQMSGNLCLFSPLVNFPLLPLIPICLILILLKTLCSFVCSCGEIFCAAALSFLLKCMLLIAEWGSRLPGTILSGSQPPISVIIFYAGLIMLLFVHYGSLSASGPSQWTGNSEGRQEQAEPR